MCYVKKMILENGELIYTRSLMYINLQISIIVVHEQIDNLHVPRIRESYTNLNLTSLKQLFEWVPLKINITNHFANILSLIFDVKTYVKKHIYY